MSQTAVNLQSNCTTCDSGEKSRFYILPDETLAESLKRIACEQVRHAQASLANQEADLDERIHDARVSFKKLRAVLRLARYELGNETFKRENHFYRDAGRRLSTVRDTAAIVEILSKLSDRFADEFCDPTLESLRQSFLTVEKKEIPDKISAVNEMASVLDVGYTHISEWSLEDHGFGTVEKGLRHSFKQGASAFNKAAEDRLPESFHEIRKKTKYLFYQTKILKPVRPNKMKKLAKRLKKLVGYLSDHHDLVVLLRSVPNQTRTMPIDCPIDVFSSLISVRLKELEDEAFPLAQKVFSKKPRKFVRGVEKYWASWN